MLIFDKRASYNIFSFALPFPVVLLASRPVCSKSRYEHTADPIKGKAVISHSQGFRSMNRLAEGRQKNAVKWSPPADGMAKLNTDGSFVSANDAGAGVILRDHTGQVICAASR
jgi:hypothetical protein